MTLDASSIVDADAQAGDVTPGRPVGHRIIWFADLETLVERLDLLVLLRDELGLTTVMLESHISHTSGFMAAPEVAGPLEDWRHRPGLRPHREVFGVAATAMAVLPGVVGGMDDGHLLRALSACRAGGSRSVGSRRPVVLRRGAVSRVRCA